MWASRRNSKVCGRGGKPLLGFPAAATPMLGWWSLPAIFLDNVTTVDEAFPLTISSRSESPSNHQSDNLIV